MRPLLCIAALVLLLAVPALAGGAAPPPPPVYHAENGILYFGGNRMEPPYTLTYRDAEIVVNGYRLAAGSAEILPLSSSESRAGHRLHRLCLTLHRDGRSKGWSDQRILETWRDSCAHDPNVSEVRVRGRSLVLWIGPQRVRVGWALPGDRPSRESAPGDSVLPDELRAIQQYLEWDGVVFIGRDSHIGFGREKLSLFESGIAKSLRGESLSDYERLILPPKAQALIRKPLKLVPVQ